MRRIERNSMEREFWKNRKVLITGHTGFKGSWLSIMLMKMGAEVIGIGLEPYTAQDNYVVTGLKNKMQEFRGDIRDREFLRKVFREVQPEIVFHLAAQPLVRLSYEKPVETYEVNVMGTMNILECIRHTDSVKEGIMITTDKCYENLEQTRGYKENDRFGGYDPYSSSKGCAEILISSYRNSYFPTAEYDKHKKALVSVRAGNVIGGGDWAKDRIVPDCIRALRNKESIKIRSPKAIRPWEHVLEPLSGYILLAEKLYEDPVRFSGGWNFGPEQETFVTVWNIAQKIVDAYGTGKLEDISNPEDVHEAKLLFLDITKAKEQLGWKPRLSINETINYTVEWYRKFEHENVYALCEKQIEKFYKVL